MKKSDNIIIAEFLGFEKVETWYEDIKMLLPQHIYDNNEGNGFDEDEILFDKSWDWLMPVIQKLFNTSYKDYSNLEELMSKYLPHDLNMLGYNIEILFAKTVKVIKNLRK